MLESLKILATALCLAYLGLVLVAALSSQRLIFPAPFPTYAASDFPLRLETTAGDSVVAIHHPPADSEAPLLLYFHGNGEDLGMLEERFAEMVTRGFAILAIDYPGYGRSSGTASETALLSAADTALAYAQDTLGYPPRRIFAYGNSLGGGPATLLASHHDLGGLILEATFTSCFRVVTLARILPWDVFDNLARIRELRCPVLIMHGRRDQTVPFSHSERLAAAANTPVETLWVDDANHLNIQELAPERYWSALECFAKRTDASPCSKP